MAESSESDPVPSSSVSQTIETKIDDEGPTPGKRRRLRNSDKLEHRLGGILSCAVCLDLPHAAIYQCSNGHLMCAPCFTHLLADARLRDDTPTCPNCRIEISKSTASRNLAVEKAISELPLECRFCAKVFPRHSLRHHEEVSCEDRLTGCRYAIIGCEWRGPAHEALSHEAACAHPNKSASEVVPLLLAREREARDDRQIYMQILDLLSYEKIIFNDLQLKPYRTDEFVHKLFYETSRFTAFNHQWVVKAFVDTTDDHHDPTQSYNRDLTYQVVLKSKPSSPLSLQFVALRGPYGEGELRPAIHAHVFATEDSTIPHSLSLHPHDANRLLANKAIHLRLIMFLCLK